MGIKAYREAITEKDLEAQVKDLAKLFGWKYYHTWRSIHSPAGFPDCVLVRPPRLIFAELKSEKGKVSPEQEEWLEILRECVKYITLVPQPLKVDKVNKTIKIPKVSSKLIPSLEIYLWRPSDFDEIVEVLR